MTTPDPVQEVYHRIGIHCGSEFFEDDSTRDDYHFMSSHVAIRNRFSEQGRGAPTDAHPSKVQKIGVRKVNHHQRLPYGSTEMRQDPDGCEILTSILSPVSEYLNTQLKQLLPVEHGVLTDYVESLPLAMESPAYPFLGFALNLCVATSAHKDRNDKAICAVVPFGEWTGGELCLYELGLVFDVKPGDIIMFPSDKVTHFNLDFIGKRGSFALQSDVRMDDWLLYRNHWDHNIVRHTYDDPASQAST
ncbi:hypothetical protein BDN72DRAFT_907163 [Pluteus cervinus]|uniref:Uncharacterized protein n=1 Tax=Pluteus cervinus TaxID=181527 RepID=A0ACD2ZWZ9_9AGAR|nr:hypothetical protein BDN72DRAFT_907163 [Pluteus cervinus]